MAIRLMYKYVGKISYTITRLPTLHFGKLPAKNKAKIYFRCSLFQAHPQPDTAHCIGGKMVKAETLPVSYGTIPPLEDKRSFSRKTAFAALLAGIALTSMVVGYSMTAAPYGQVNVPSHFRRH